jgi:RNA polymerase sigma-70 factor (ECF subfamily)
MDATHATDASDPDLLAAVAHGDRSAFELLYRAYEKRVYQYVQTLVSDRSLAEEVVGDTMLAVWRGAGSFACTSRVSTWIFGIARHKALDAIRRSGRRQREVELDGAAELPHPQACPDDAVWRNQLATLTQRAMATLTREHREILRLVFYEEQPYEEIAMLLGIPTNTVKTRVYYAKQRLKEQLAHLGHREPIR